ncbi:MAG TPA: membrane dipeptidase [Candidatus Paceibacterota bacterium]|nr:membrane dipeptidase [Candidatus Paceibacterota bacterium]
MNMSKRKKKRLFIDLHQDLANYFTDARVLLEMPKEDFTKSFPDCRHADLPGYEQAGTLLTCATIFPFTIKRKKIVLEDASRQLESDLKVYRRLFKRGFFPVKTRGDVPDIPGEKVGLLLHMEGAEALFTPEDVARYFALGVRSIGLTWRYANHLAGGDTTKKGVTSHGADILRAMREAGLILDLTHLSKESFRDALRLWDGPFMVSHTAFSAFYSHPQNLEDWQIRSVVKKKGLIGISFLKSFYGEKRVTMESVADQLDWFRGKYGVRNLAVGSDFFGFTLGANPEGLYSIYSLPSFAVALARRGWSDAEIDGLFWENAHRFLKRSLPK